MKRKGERGEKSFGEKRFKTFGQKGSTRIRGDGNGTKGFGGKLNV